MDLFLGVDPGKTGGLALVARTKNGDFVLISATIMPVSEDRTTKCCVNSTAAYQWFKGTVTTATREWSDAKFVVHGVIENVHAMPRQGVSSSFQFGRMFGGAEVVVQALSFDMVYVTPQKWKRFFCLSSRKGESIKRATQAFGNDFWPLKKHDGIAEAALMALWLAQQPKG